MLYPSNIMLQSKLITYTKNLVCKWCGYNSIQKG